MTEAFVTRCVLAFFVGIVCGIWIHPLWLAVAVGLGINFVVGAIAEMEYDRGRQEIQDKVNAALDKVNAALDNMPPSDVESQS